MPVDELDALAEAGITLVGENRAQELDREAATHPGPFTWDFIGNLQSRKVRDVLPHVRYIHSVASDSVLAQLDRHGTAQTEVLIEVNVAGEPGKGGIEPAELPAFLERCPVTVVGLMTMPPLADRAGGQPRRISRALRELAARHGLRAAVDGHQPGLRGGGAGGGDDRAPRIQSCTARRAIICRAGKYRARANPDTDMAFRDTWHRTLVYFGLAEDEAYEDETSSPTPSPRSSSRTATASARTSGG